MKMNHEGPNSNGEFRERNWQLACPHCGEEFVVTVAMKSEQLRTQRAESTDRFSPEDLELLSRLETAGLLAAFEQATRRAKANEMPKDMKRFFLVWLRTVRPVTIPRESLDILMANFEKSYVTVMGSQGILMVLADRRPRLFVPADYTGPTAHQRKRLPPGMSLPMPVTELSEWIRTRNGYVAGHGLLWDELKGKAYGEFAKPRL
jgi:hypothetical protein